MTENILNYILWYSILSNTIVVLDMMAIKKGWLDRRFNPVVWALDKYLSGKNPAYKKSLKCFLVKFAIALSLIPFSLPFIIINRFVDFVNYLRQPREIEIEAEPLSVKCNICLNTGDYHEWAVKEFPKTGELNAARCPYCNSTDISILSGEYNEK